MARGDAPLFNVKEHGLWRRVVTQSDEINVGQWNRTRAEDGFVGTCRKCGGHLAPVSVDQGEDGNREWWEASCISCRTTIAAPRGRVLRGSARRSEMPFTWWENRERENRLTG